MTPPRLPAPGDSVGPYTLIRALDGHVFEATGTEGERLALKIVPALGLDQPDADSLRERFVREIGVGVGVFHPNLAALLDADLEDSFGFVVSPLFEGETLASRMARGATLGESEQNEISLALESAVAALHEAGLSHRGIYPRNVLLVPLDGRDKILLLEPGGFVRRATTTEAQTRDEAAIYTLFTAPGSVAPDPPPVSALVPSAREASGDVTATNRESHATQLAKTVPPSARSPQNDEADGANEGESDDDGRSEPLELRPRAGVRRSVVELSEPAAGPMRSVIPVVIVVGVLLAVAAFLLSRLPWTDVDPALPDHRRVPRDRTRPRSRAPRARP